MTWTTELPTEPGTYWVSLDPALRELRWRTDEVFPVQLCARNERLMIIETPYGEQDAFICYLDSLQSKYVGAKWAKREVPADPWVTP